MSRNHMRIDEWQCLAELFSSTAIDRSDVVLSVKISEDFMKAVHHSFLLSTQLRFQIVVHLHRLQQVEIALYKLHLSVLKFCLRAPSNKNFSSTSFFFSCRCWVRLTNSSTFIVILQWAPHHLKMREFEAPRRSYEISPSSLYFATIQCAWQAFRRINISLLHISADYYFKYVIRLFDVCKQSC